MRILQKLVALLIASAATAAQAETTIDFEKEVLGAAPKGFTVAQTGPGAAPRWEVREDTSAPSSGSVLVQASDDATRARFPLAIYDAAHVGNGMIRVRFKALSGEVDQAAGLVFRYRDPNNYYIVRANALERNVVLYKVEDGERTDLEPIGAGLFTYGKKAAVESGRWHTLRVDLKGELFRVQLDGAPLFEVRDATFAEPGQVGLWTKADSVTAFDDLTIAPAPAGP